MFRNFGATAGDHTEQLRGIAEAVATSDKSAANVNNLPGDPGDAVLQRERGCSD